jgi:dTDP-4-dehydrorhamnose reductase
MKALVLGGSGMLGAMMVEVLSHESGVAVVATVRTPSALRTFQALYPAVEWRLCDAEHEQSQHLARALEGAGWVINCIGVIKPYIHEGNAGEVERAIRVNSLFPHRLAQVAEEAGCRVLQIATDCVFSGRRGQYLEQDIHDAGDVYGKTKSLGEVFSPWVHHLRASIIGPEPSRHLSLLDWFLSQPAGAHVKGFANHRWNGVTTLHFARLCLAIVQGTAPGPPLRHVLPDGSVSKAELLRLIAESYRRQDLHIDGGEADKPCDRTLATSDLDGTRELWAAAGYDRPPSIAPMITELAEFECRFAREPWQRPTLAICARCA